MNSEERKVYLKVIHHITILTFEYCAFNHFISKNDHKGIWGKHW